MDVQDLVDQFAQASVPGLGALIAAWLTWRLWRRLLRAAIACVVVGVVLYVAFPGVTRQLMRDGHGFPTFSTGEGAAGSP
ncbi:MAG: hypothetical protein ABW137_32515 [Mycobacterium sp.]